MASQTSTSQNVHVTQPLLDLNDRWWDWQVASWDGESLRLIADNDLTYHHSVEVLFEETAYVKLPAQFSHPVFRAPTASERELVRQAVGDLPALIVAWDIDAEGPGRACLVGAASVSFAEELVLHY